jgi:hypothetical protein
MGITRIGDHVLDEDEDYESDQLRDDAEENGVPEPFEPMPPPSPGMIIDDAVDPEDNE